MRIRVPVTYQIHCIPKGKRSEHLVEFGEHIDIEIKEVDDFDAPVATRWPELNEAFGFNGWSETRFFNGQHYRPVLTITNTEDDKEEWRPLAVERFAQEMAEGCDDAKLLSANDYSLRQFIRGKIADFNKTDFKSVDTYNLSIRQNAIDAIHGEAARAIVLDGLLWKASPEPVYNVRKFPGVATRFQVYPRFLDDIRIGFDESRMRDVYRADRFEDALADCEARNGGALEDQALTHITLFMPESISYDDERWSIIGTAKHVIKYMGKMKAEEFPTALLLPYAELRLLIESAEHTWDDEVAEDLLERLKQVVMARSSGSDVDSFNSLVARWKIGRSSFPLVKLMAPLSVNANWQAPSCDH